MSSGVFAMRRASENDRDTPVPETHIDVTTEDGDFAIYDKENTSAYLSTPSPWDVRR